MTDDTSKEVKVEVPQEFDAKYHSMRALIHAVQEGVEHLFSSYGKHVNKQSPVVSVKVPTVVVDPGTNSTETVYEDTKIEAIDE